MTGKRFGLWLCILALALGLLRIPAALALTLAEPQPGEELPAVSTYQVTLDAQTIGAGETLSYEVIAPEFAGNPAAADYYPGELTVELTGRIVIEEGGCLAIGILSSGSEEERSPVLRGSCSPDGLIVVRSGGSLILRNVSLQLEGEGSFVVQEPGGSVALTGTEPDDGLIVWAPPTVDNAHQQPRDLWLEEGTALTAAMLPSTLGTYLQYRGGERWETFALQWDMDPYEGQTEGEYTLTGAFLDEAGEALASVRPLTLTVHWYQPGRLVVTGATWLGQTAASAKLELKELPEEADEVWGEVSADGGKTWERWEEFQYQEEKHGVPCEFFLPDSVPQHFRVRAASERDHLYWISEAVLLPKEDAKPTDQGGNRGGSTAVVRPSRKPSQPEPTPTPTPTPEPTPTPTPMPTPTPTPSPTPTPTPEPTPTPTPKPTTPPSPEPSAESVPTVEATPPAVVAMAPAVPATAAPKPTASVTAEPTPSPSPSPEPIPSAEPIPTAGPAPTAGPETTPEVTPPPAPTVADGQESPPPIAQIMLVAAGAVLCGGMGVYVARRKRK